MNNTGIIWTERTWNPMSGCHVVSEGCKFCFAKTLAENRRGTAAFPNGFDLTLRPHKMVEPIKLKSPTLIFVNSMSDMFWEKVPNDYRHKIIDVMERTPMHQYQVLTKRPENMLKFSRERQLPDNFWAGTTVDNDRWKHRIDILRKVKASLHFISAEPLIGPITSPDLGGIDWLITGGESGVHLWDEQIAHRRALVRYDREAKKWVVRDDRAQWIRHLRDVSVAAGVKFFHKQWGGHYPEAAGRVLDGRTWNEMPRLPAQHTEINNDYLRHLEATHRSKQQLVLDGLL